MVDGTSLKGMLIGVLISTSITGVIQSSGATIGMCYALIDAGVFTQLVQVYPIVLGAHIGTCATAMLGSIGTNIEARRTAVSHLTFNIMNVAMAVAASPFFLWLVPKTSADLTHQTANLHSIVIGVAAFIVLPMSRLHAGLMRIIVPSRKAPPQPSYLNEDLLDRPEQAIYASIRELRRIAQTCHHSLRLNAELFFEQKRKVINEIKLNEKVVNEIKVAMKSYLTSVTHRYLSRRQQILIQHIDRCMVDIERIGDHIDEMCDLSLRRMDIPEALFDEESFKTLFELYEEALDVLKLVIESLDPENKDFQAMAKRILKARDEYMEQSIDTKTMFNHKMAKRIMPPMAGIFYNEYLAVLDRIVKHAKTIALVESQPEFWIKRRKLDRVVDEAPEYEPPPFVDPHDFLDQLQSEDYL
jgi:phosphate:Na+ symporter